METHSRGSLDCNTSFVDFYENIMTMIILLILVNRIQLEYISNLHKDFDCLDTVDGLCKKKTYKYLLCVCVCVCVRGGVVRSDGWEKDLIEHARPEKEICDCLVQ